jgi:choline dehydrogenase-like flavoprotein
MHTRFRRLIVVGSLLAGQASAFAQTPTPAAVPAVGRIERIEAMPSRHVGPRHVDVWLPADYSPAKRYQVLYMHDSPLPIPDDHPLAHNPWGYANVGFGIRKFARYEDWIEFDDTDLDWAGMPNVTIHYEFTDREEAELEGARRRQRQVAGAIGSFIPGGEPAPLPYGASLHYKGTMRIGETDDGTSVCDPWSRVWSIDNLYLGGNGTIPTNTVVNPTLTSVAIALRGARGILSSIAREEEAE